MSSARLTKLRDRSLLAVPSVLVVALAIGWATREAAFAKERKDGFVVASQTITLDHVKMEPFSNENRKVGEAGTYLMGDTPASRTFITGRFVLEPGQTPHKPHKHVEEEVMIVETGTGEIFCDGKTTKVGPGSVMYTSPDAPHGIVNTGDKPLTFYFIKWAAVAPK